MIFLPTRLIKDNSDIFAKVIIENFNADLENSNFSEEYKVADKKTVFKKGNRSDKTSYRPVSILLNLSKIYERCIFNQMNKYFQNILSKYQFGFRKGHSVQQCLVVMIEKWKRCLDHGGFCGSLLTDLYKAFDCLPHDLLIEKLEAFGFDNHSLRLILVPN